MKANGLTKETILNIDAQDRGFPQFSIGDTVEVSLLVKEAGKERVQAFSGDVIAQHKNGISSTFIVRKISANGVGVEKIFPYYSPIINNIKVLKRGKVRRAKLFYIRERVGKAARIEEEVLTRQQKEAIAEKAK